MFHLYGLCWYIKKYVRLQLRWNDAHCALFRGLLCSIERWSDTKKQENQTESVACTNAQIWQTALTRWRQHMTKVILAPWNKFAFMQISIVLLYLLLSFGMLYCFVRCCRWIFTALNPLAFCWIFELMSENA